MTAGPPRRRGAAYLWATLIGALIGAVLVVLPLANAWIPVWAAALDPAVSAAPAAELYRMAPDGSNQTRLSITDADERSPAVSPDGTRVAVKLWPAEGDVPQTLAVFDIGTGELTSLLTEGSVNQPSWSPDGQRILFGWQRDGASDVQLWWVPADGSAPPARLLEDEDNSFAGQWSPDGQSLLFASDRDGFGLYVANADGTEIGKIVDAPRYADATWSPDSTRIAFTSDEAGSFGLSTVAADGSDLALVKVFSGAVLLPDWTPDGRTLVFESHQAPDGEVGSVAIDGTDEHNLTRNPGMTDAMGGPTVARDGSIIYAAAANQPPAFIPLIRERLGVAALLVQAVLLALGAGVLLGGGRVSFGALTVMVAVAAGLALGRWGAWAFLPAAIVAGLAADGAAWALRTGPRRRLPGAVTVGTLTGAYVAGYLATVGSTLFVDWPGAWWPGGIGEVAGIGYELPLVLVSTLGAAAIGIVVGYLSAGPEPAVTAG